MAEAILTLGSVISNVTALAGSWIAQQAAQRIGTQVSALGMPATLMIGGFAAVFVGQAAKYLVLLGFVLMLLGVVALAFSSGLL